MKLTTFKYFYPERPRLIHIDQPLCQKLSDSKEWIAELKYNGSRLQLHCIDREVQFWNRHGERMAYKPTEEIQEILPGIYSKGYSLFDGELRHNKTVGVRHKIILYDVFIWHDDLLIGKPFWYRRNLLEKILAPNGEPIGIPEQFGSEFRSVFNRVTTQPEIEGLVMKNTRGTLQLSRNAPVNSRWMCKVRKANGSYRF